MLQTIRIEKGLDVKQELFQKYEEILPGELIHWWREYGLGELLEGYLRIINPEEYQELLEDTYFRGKISVPILTTAFGDIITFEKHQYVGMVKYKNGNFEILADSFKHFTKYIMDDYFWKMYFEIPQYTEAVKSLGKLEHDECFGYVPLLGLGGGEKLDHLQKVKMREHILIISQLVGAIGM